MSIDTSLQGRDLFMRTTDQDGRVTHSFHRVWDADRFVQARKNEAAKLNAEKHSTKASAEQVSAEQHRARA